MSIETETLLEAARRAREKAYAPYSKFAVGAALRTADGSIFTGANVENSSLGLSLCAERLAACSAVAAGHRQFQAIAVVGPTGALSAPCGACRQVLAEFSIAMRVMYVMSSAAVQTTLYELLPDRFTFDGSQT
ncbi:MAG: cytidine deaminase [Candidatus Eremiobacteraeota bacterium]|nr:cytidine deaminase [Candidatus Eremiobacteraeota bacterium]